MKILLLIVTVFTSLIISAQLKTDLTIISEKENISFTGNQVSNMVVTIKKESEILINNENGILSLSNISIPKPIDETYYSNATKIRNIKKCLDFIRIKNIEIIVSNSSGERKINTENPEKKFIKTVVNKNEINFLNGLSSDLLIAGQKYMDQDVNTEQFGEYTKYIYKIDSLKVGDIVKIKYKYEANFSDNIVTLLSNRKFFHSKYPKKHYELNWSYDKKLNVDTFFANHSNYKVNTSDKLINIKWVFDNLPAALIEKNSKAYIDLPYFAFLPKPDDFLTRDVDSYDAFYLPTYYYLANHRERKFKKAIVDSKIGIKDKDNLAINKIFPHFYDNTKSANNLRNMQRFMVDSVKYDNSEKYYAREQTSTKNHIGIDIQDRFIKDNNIEQIYSYWLSKMEYNYFTAYISDNRIAQIGKNYLTPVNSENMLFVPYYDEKYPMYVYPKQELNYYADELPFYLEGSNILLLSSNDYGDTKRNFERNTKISKTPKSKLADNYRITKSKVKISSSNKCEFNTNLTLSGQYSTLARPIYLNKNTDKTINNLYLEPVWQISSNTKLKENKILKANYYFPFKHNFEFNYNDDKLVSIESKNIEINLTKLINHIIIENIDSTSFLNRTTSFFADFVGRDTYNYLFEFENSVEILNKETNISVKNTFGTYNFSIKQINPNLVLVSSVFITNNEKTNKEDIKNVFDIFNAINKVENSKLILKYK